MLDVAEGVGGEPRALSPFGHAGSFFGWGVHVSSSDGTVIKPITGANREVSKIRFSMAEDENPEALNVAFNDELRTIQFLRTADEIWRQPVLPLLPPLPANLIQLPCFGNGEPQGRELDFRTGVPGG